MGDIAKCGVCGGGVIDILAYRFRASNVNRELVCFYYGGVVGISRDKERRDATGR